MIGFIHFITVFVFFTTPFCVMSMSWYSMCTAQHDDHKRIQRCWDFLQISELCLLCFVSWYPMRCCSSVSNNMKGVFKSLLWVIPCTFLWYTMRYCIFLFVIVLWYYVCVKICDNVCRSCCLPLEFIKDLSIASGPILLVNISIRSWVIICSPTEDEASNEL